jgi:hypothetical protein
MVRLLLVVLALASVGTAHASPLIHFTLEGRKLGTEDAFSSDLQVGLGDRIEYRLQVNLSLPTLPWHEIRKNRVGTTLHGLNSLFLEISQDASDGIQIDFDSPSALTADSSPGVGDGWDSGTGARGGVPESRSGTPFHNLVDIRPVHGPGVFTAVDRETVLTGTFEVASLSGSSAEIRGRWATAYDDQRRRSGGGHWNGNTRFTHAAIENGPDAISEYVPLTLTAIGLQAVPEPSTVALVAVMAGVLVVVPRFRRKPNR